MQVGLYLVIHIDDGDTYSSDSVFNNLAVGSYDIKVEITYGCTIDSSFVINEYDSLFIHLDSIQKYKLLWGYKWNDFNYKSMVELNHIRTLWTGPNRFTSTATSITDLYIGTYSVNYDINLLCLIADSFEISKSTPLQLNVVNTSVQDVSYKEKMMVEQRLRYYRIQVHLLTTSCGLMELQMHLTRPCQE